MQPSADVSKSSQTFHCMPISRGWKVSYMEGPMYKAILGEGVVLFFEMKIYSFGKQQGQASEVAFHLDSHRWVTAAPFSRKCQDSFSPLPPPSPTFRLVPTGATVQVLLKLANSRCRHSIFFCRSQSQCLRKKYQLAKLRRCVTWVHFAKIHYGHQ